MRAVDKRRYGTKSVTIIKRTSGGVLLLLYDAVSPLTKTLYSVKIK